MQATEMLGVVLAFGPKPNLQKFMADDWDRAGRAGFAFTSRARPGSARPSRASSATSRSRAG